MLLEFFYMLEVCCGSGASSRAMITHMRRLGREGRSLLIDIMTLDQLLLRHPELSCRLLRSMSSTDATGGSAAAGRRLARRSMVKAQQLSCISGMHHMVMGLSQHKATQDTGGGSSGV